MPFRTLQENELFVPDFKRGHRLPIKIRGVEPADLIAYAAYRFGSEAFFLGFDLSQTITVDPSGKRQALMHRPLIEWSEPLPANELLVDTPA